MTDRITYSSASTPPTTGDDYMDNVSGHLKKLYDVAAMPLTSPGGTANAVTASLDPILDGSGLVEGMHFGITWANTNTGPTTLSVNGGTAIDVVDAAGDALTGGELVGDERSTLEIVGGEARLMSSGGNSSTVVTNLLTIERYTTSDTWTKPDDFIFGFVFAWAGGGGGGRTNQGSIGSAAGGGGGEFGMFLLDLVTAPSTAAVTIGAGGAGRTTVGTGNDGGNTSLGSLFTIEGGDGGEQDTGGAGISSANGGNFTTGSNLTEHGGVSGSVSVSGIASDGDDTVSSGGGGGSVGREGTPSSSNGGSSYSGGNGGDGNHDTPVAGECDGSFPGGGGGGSYNGTSGAGGDGLMVIVSVSLNV